MSELFSRVFRHSSANQPNDVGTARAETAHVDGRVPDAVTRISQLRPRSIATLHGTLRSVTLRPVEGVSWLEAELDDGTGSLLLIWLGRRKIAGINCGREMTVHGRIGERDGDQVIFNPKYELTA